MAQTVADFILHRLRQWGVEHVFCYPGDGINALVSSLGGSKGPAVIQPRHEEMGAFEAVGYAKFGGRVGVCMATSGPGAIHLLNGLYDAKLDRVPVVAIVGQAARSTIGGSYQQEVDLHALFKDVCSEFVQTAMVPEQFPNLLDRAIRTALSNRCPTAVIVPSDLQEEAYSPPPHTQKSVPSSVPGYVRPITTAPSAEIARAAALINAGDRVAILIGQGARDAAPEVTTLAEVTAGGVAKALLGKDVLPDDLPYVTGSIGLLGTRPSWEMMRDCDTLVIVGSSFPYADHYPEFGKARAVQIDVDARNIGMRYPTEVNLVGDAAATLQELIPQLKRKKHGKWRKTIEAGVARWWETMEMQAKVKADPVNPLLVFHELSRRLPHNAIVTADSGSVADWYARQLRFRLGMRGSLSGTLASMGAGVPYAIGAKIANPDRPVFSMMGDGAMQMNGLAEMLTVKRYWKDWADPRLIVMVLHNNDLNQVTWELRALGGSPRVPATQDLPEVSYAAFAESIGLEGIAVDRPEDVGPAWDRALAAGRPVVLDVRTNADVPPIPPHADYSQMKDTAEALLKGDQDLWGVIKEGVRTKSREFVPHRR
ncbi:thiamine pyrophosphate-requiring protein [Bailinhaonella thermotolerans]|uniref:Thiamine pyrophosphate-requiring protein n=1 Tax=Bailinhaonella thermotolerans TaxID=1070861 RepID=A0A3A4AYF8_9ACTN|nr:thiamine pyrophosphate-requiring protein [Bailinhaonella thermotolerans]RJL32536.1 thiamine pyrophosphate-requiring protein [Bailinhaonella thermotolerans]